MAAVPTPAPDWFDAIAEWLSAIDFQALFLIALLLIGARVLQRVLSADNPVEAWHFIASRGDATKDNETGQWGDPKKLAVAVFIFSSTVFVGYTFWSTKEFNFWVFAIFMGWAIAMLGIDVFASWARSFVDRRFGQAGGEPPKVPQGDKP